MPAATEPTRRGGLSVEPVGSRVSVARRTCRCATVLPTDLERVHSLAATLCCEAIRSQVEATVAVHAALEDAFIPTKQHSNTADDFFRHVLQFSNMRIDAIFHVHVGIHDGNHYFGNGFHRAFLQSMVANDTSAVRINEQYSIDALVCALHHLLLLLLQA